MHYRTVESILGEPIPEPSSVMQAELDAAFDAGQFGMGIVQVRPNASGPVNLGVSSFEQPSSKDFAPNAMVLCGRDPVSGVGDEVFVNWNTYFEMEATTTGGGDSGGGGGLLGSLADPSVPLSALSSVCIVHPSCRHLDVDATSRAALHPMSAAWDPRAGMGPASELNLPPTGAAIAISDIWERTPSGIHRAPTRHPAPGVGARPDAPRVT